MSLKRAKRAKSAAAVILAVSFMASAPLAIAEEGVSKQVETEVRSILSQVHVSGVTEDQLKGLDVDGMLKKLGDPFTTYFSPEAWGQFAMDLEDQYVGIGTRVTSDDDGIYIDEVFPKSPAEAAGLMAGDVLKAVDGVPAVPGKVDETLKLMKGVDGSTVRITVSRSGQTKELIVKRGAVALPPVYGHLFSGGAGYIEIFSFTSGADEQFADKLGQLRKQGLKSLIIDLRGNPGGYLETAKNIAKQFVPEGYLMNVRDRDLVVEPVEIHNGSSFSMPVYLLVDENSASASEVFTGMMQDYKLAMVIGTKTYGKGSVQTFYSLSDGGELKVTIEEYLTPKLRKVNHVGLEPDVKEAGGFNQLFTAMRLAGEPDIEVTLQKRESLVNGQDLNMVIPFKTEKGRYFVPSRLLAAMVNADIGWNGELEAVDFTKNNILVRYKADPDRMIEENGTSYISVDDFAKYYPSFHWSVDGKNVKLEAN